jgi:phospholipid/cholesterol/gamma-HCH transport system ATP-binding protein
MFLYQGKNWWTGTNKEVLKSNNDELNNFVFASPFMKTVFKSPGG